MKTLRPWLALPGVLLAGGCSLAYPFVAPLPGSDVVPWVAATPGSRTSQTPQPIPARTRACDVSQLVVSAQTAGGGGTVLGVLTLMHSQADARPCFLAGSPSQIAIQRTDTGREIPIDYSASRHAGPGAQDAGSAHELLLDEGAVVATSFIWTNWCGEPLKKVRFLMKTSTAASAPIGISNAVDAEYGSARCDRPGVPSHITGYAFRNPPSQPENLDVSIDVPPTAVAGRPLDYVVSISNNDVRPLSLDPCPAYTEQLFRPKQRESHEEQWVLNCGGLPAKVWPGERVELAMQIAVPVDMTLGPAEIDWSFVGGRAFEPIEVVAH